MKITALKQQQKNPNRVSVYVDSKYCFSLSLDQVVDYKIKQGQELRQPDVKKFQKLSLQGKQKARALEWLLSRPHSEREFIDYLKRKKIDTELIEILLDEFKEKKYLNDEYFAKWWIENRRRSKLSSSKKIIYELRSKGVNSQIIEDQIHNEPNSEEQALKLLIEKKLKMPRYSNDKEKLKAYLIRQGFSYSLVKELLNK